VGFIGGPPKAGKSWLALDLAIAVASGTPFLGRNVIKPGPVLYFLGEEYRDDVVRRVDRMLLAKEMDRASLKLNFLVTENVPLLEDKAQQSELGLAAEEERATLIIFDPLERFLGQGDTNASKDMRAVNSFFRQALTRERGSSVCVIHHTDKKGKGLRGTGDFRAVSEVTMLLGEPSNKRIQLKTEMRGASAPEPFYLTLKDGADERIEWSVVEARLAERDEEARQLLLGHGRLTSDEIRVIMKIRAAEVPPMMERIGARRVSARGPWEIPKAELKIVPKAEEPSGNVPAPREA
jgi:hypothetical protein